MRSCSCRPRWGRRRQPRGDPSSAERIVQHSRDLPRSASRSTSHTAGSTERRSGAPSPPASPVLLSAHLDALVGGWFHQDFDLAGGTLEEVVAAFKKSSPSEDWLGTKADIKRFLRTRGEEEIDARLRAAISAWCRSDRLVRDDAKLAVEDLRPSVTRPAYLFRWTVLAAMATMTVTGSLCAARRLAH